MVRLLITTVSCVVQNFDDYCIVHNAGVCIVRNAGVCIVCNTIVCILHRTIVRIVYNRVIYIVHNAIVNKAFIDRVVTIQLLTVYVYIKQ